MKKKELVDRVLKGESVAHPPVSMWYHFGVQHGGGEQFAKITLGYFEHYDFDFLKVMNDYFYPVPPGLTAINNAKDLQRLVRFKPEETSWAQQFKALEIINY